MQKTTVLISRLNTHCLLFPILTLMKYEITYMEQLDTSKNKKRVTDFILSKKWNLDISFLSQIY